jgi:hypothetical protein
MRAEYTNSLRLQTNRADIRRTNGSNFNCR